MSSRRGRRAGERIRLAGKRLGYLTCTFTALLVAAGGVTAAPEEPESAGDSEDILHWSSPDGPFPFRSQHPLQMTFLDFEMRGARTLDPGRVRLDVGFTYTSMFQTRQDTNSGVIYDGEWGQVALDLRLGVLEGLEVFAGLPFLYTTSGFLDSFLQTIEPRETRSARC